MSGYLITLEGIEGSGKSTQLEYVIDYLNSKNFDVVSTREPGGTVVGEKVRELLLDNTIPDMHVETELMLMFAARIEHVKKVIEPALNSNKVIVCDRFYDASYAYQGYGRGIDIHRIDELRKYSISNLCPDLTILLDVPLDVSIDRVHARGKKDRFENEENLFYKKIREGYLEIAKNNPARVKVVDSSQSISDVQSNIKSSIDELLNIGEV